jgi:hypothetical protein
LEVTLVTAGEGLAFGKPPTKIPLSTHLYALASHFVYGAVTEAVRRVIRKAL